MTDWHNNQGSEAGLVETLTVQFCIVCDSVVVSEDLRVVVNIDNNLFSHGYERGCKHNLIKVLDTDQSEHCNWTEWNYCNNEDLLNTVIIMSGKEI